jgi:hypothetical protein
MVEAYCKEPLEAGEPASLRRRSWLERLFSWPWKPWLKLEAKRL